MWWKGGLGSTVGVMCIVWTCWYCIFLPQGGHCSIGPEEHCRGKDGLRRAKGIKKERQYSPLSKSKREKENLYVSFVSIIKVSIDHLQSIKHVVHESYKGHFDKGRQQIDLGPDWNVPCWALAGLLKQWWRGLLFVHSSVLLGKP